MVQLETEVYGWLAWIDDVSLGHLYVFGPLFGSAVLIGNSGCAFWGVCNCPGTLSPYICEVDREMTDSEFQHTDSDPATDFLRTCTRKLGTDPDI